VEIVDLYTVRVTFEDVPAVNQYRVLVVATVTDVPDAVTLSAEAADVLALTDQEIDLETQAANTVLAGPDAGADAKPTFRVLTEGDLPSHSHPAPDARDVTYTPAVAADWDSDADPGNADNALDQLAERVDDLEGATLGDHDHSGDAGDGGTFDAANLTSGAADDGHVLTADGAGGAAWEAPSGGMTNPMTTAEDLIVGGVDGAPGRLAKGMDGQVLKMVAGAVAWGTDETSAGGGADKFTDLTDAPASYVGQGGKYVAVKATEDGLEFL
jgi:hypothetical protein